MEIVMQESIKVPDAVVITGLTDTDTDKEIEEYLASFGSVHRIFRIDTLDYPNHCIVEFKHGTAMQALAPLLPLTYTSLTNPEVTYKVVSLDSMYSSLACNSAAKAYMKELQLIAMMSSKPFEVLLMEELAKLSSQTSQPSDVKSELESGQSPAPGVTPELEKIQEVPPPLQVESEGNKDPPKETTDAVGLAAHEQSSPSLPNAMSPPSLINTSAATSFFAPPATVKKQPLSHSFLSGDMLNPPEIQKVVVEHILKTENASSFHGSSRFRLRVFSGKSTRPSNEADYDNWRTSVDLFLTDPSVSDLDRARKIFDSLLPPIL